MDIETAKSNAFELGYSLANMGWDQESIWDQGLAFARGQKGSDGPLTEVEQAVVAWAAHDAFRAYWASAG